MKQIPSMDAWLKEAKQDKNAARVGMYLTHNGIVRESNKASVRYGEEEKKVTGKWLLFISVAFVGNGMCSVVQNAQQYKFGGAQNGNFMVLALFISFIALVVLAAVFEPIPGALAIAFISSVHIAMEKFSGVIIERILIATLGPTPLTDVSLLKHERSSSEPKPKSSIPSSLTAR